MFFKGQTNATVRLDKWGAAKRKKGLFDEIAVDVVRNVLFGKGSMPKIFVGVFVAITRRRRARLHPYINFYNIKQNKKLVLKLF